MSTIDAEFRETTALTAAEPQQALAVAPLVANAEAMVAKLQEWERFKALAIRPNSWIKIPGVDGSYLPAAEVDRIAPAIGLSWEIISKNEHGDPGVRAQIVEQLTYGTKTVKRYRKGGGGSYDAEVPDHTQPLRTLATVYTVTVRCRDSFGRCVDAEGTFSSLEMTKSDYLGRQQALSRARRRGSLMLIGGVDHDVFEEERAALDQSKRAAAAEAANVPSGGQLYALAKEQGFASTGTAFREWAKMHVKGCGDALDGEKWAPTVEQRRAIAEALA